MIALSSWRIVATLAGVLAGAAAVCAVRQSPAVVDLDEAALRQFAGTYQWESGSFVDLQLWAELAGSTQLMAIDESGDIRALYPTGPDRFFAGPGAAVSSSIESRVEFRRDSHGAMASLTWTREGRAPRTARRVVLERSDEVSFSNGPVRLAGPLTSPIASTRHPAIVLVHGSGAATREQVLPFARFLIRHGIAVLAFDKRGAKNRAAWDVALKAAGNPDYTLRILTKANHGYLGAQTGSNAEMPSLTRFVPEYRATILRWLEPRLKTSASSR